MNTLGRLALAGIAAAVPAALLASAPSGSPEATRPIEGRELPPPPPKFGGKIERNAAQSKPYWAPRVVPPKPNNRASE
jgi:hypothetical protein